MEGNINRDTQEEYQPEKDEFSFGNRGIKDEHEGQKVGNGNPKTMPPASVMTRLILIMVWRKLIRNPNTYSSLIGLTWSLISFRYPPTSFPSSNFESSSWSILFNIQFNDLWYSLLLFGSFFVMLALNNFAA